MGINHQRNKKVIFQLRPLQLATVTSLSIAISVEEHHGLAQQRFEQMTSVTGATTTIYDHDTTTTATTATIALCSGGGGVWFERDQIRQELNHIKMLPAYVYVIVASARCSERWYGIRSIWRSTHISTRRSLRSMVLLAVMIGCAL